MVALVTQQNKVLSFKSIERRRELYQGSSKILYDGPEPGTYVFYFKDRLDLNKNSSHVISFSGALNNRLSELLMTRLETIGIETHFLKRLNVNEQLVRAAEPLPFSIKVQNVAFGDFAKKLGLDEGVMLPYFIPEFVTCDENKKYATIAPQHIYAMGWADEGEVDLLLEKIQRINDFLVGQFVALGMRLASYQLEFGRVYLSDFLQDNQFLLIDAFILEQTVVIDIATQKKLEGLVLFDDNLDGYHEIVRRFGLLQAGGPVDLQQEYGDIKK